MYEEVKNLTRNPRTTMERVLKSLTRLTQKTRRRFFTSTTSVVEWHKGNSIHLQTTTPGRKRVRAQTGRSSTNQRKIADVPENDDQNFCEEVEDFGTNVASIRLNCIRI
ncbi:uncharacterized protein [Periplaneta americana]|uniref:uncharacterized protein n=1 Tax=Periplaneta americana TaxID=6978 RepID=UPI0037E924EA